MERTRNVVTLLTDFGCEDWFVGVMKGVLLGLRPTLNIVDLTHSVAPGGVRAGAFALAAAYRWFPRGTIHIAVVDPGVGSERPAIVVETKDYLFVGPDNGLLSLALRQETIRRIHRLENARYFLQNVSRTFHGRDVFAPVAAYLSRGVACQRFGPKQTGCQQLDWPEPRVEKSMVVGEVVYIDRFGNAISNLPSELVEAAAGNWTVQLPRGRRCPVRSFYQAVAVGRVVAVPGSTGFVEIAVNGGSAARMLRLKIGAKLRLMPCSWRTQTTPAA